MISSPLRARSFAKINLALAAMGPRPDGFHEIRTVIQSIDLCDELEFRSSERLELHCEGLGSLPREDNLVWRAAVALAEAASSGRGAEIRLKKNIPAGSGLGGGSGNAAVTLLALCRLWDLHLRSEKLMSIASAIGADVPFFLEGGTALGIGKGDELHPLPDMAPADLVVVFPGYPVSTAEAYRSLRLVLTSSEAAHKISGLCGRLRAGKLDPADVFNDFETSILPAHPDIREAKRLLMDQGATVAMLSGSGSSVFGFFIDEESALAASRAFFRESWRVFPAKTLSRSEYFQRMFG